MKANLSIQDGVIRMFLACIFGAIGGILTFSDSPFAVIGFLAVPMVVTSLSGWCPLYVPFKFYTCEENPYTAEGHGHPVKKASATDTKYAH